MGPACQYQLVSRRLDRNPLFLTRNLYRRKASRIPKSKNRMFQVELGFDSLPPSGLITFHVIHKMAADAHYSVLCSSTIDIPELPDRKIYLKFPVKDEMESIYCQDLFLLVLLSAPGHTRLAHERWVGTICKAASENLISGEKSEIVEIQLPCHAVLIDLHNVYLVKHKRASQLARSDLKAFMFPATKEQRSLDFTKKLKCRVPSVKMECDNKVACEVAVTVRQDGRLRKSARSRKQQSWSNVPECHGCVLYHCMSALDARNRKVWYEKRTNYQCVWCEQSFNFQDTRSPQMAAFRALNALFMHMNTFHSHFQYDVSMDAKGIVHVVVCSPGVVAEMGAAPTEFKEPSTFEVSIWPHASPEAYQSQDRSGALAIDKRTFYHVATGQPMTKTDFRTYLQSATNLDGDNPDVDLNGYALRETHRQVEEYVDLNTQEQAFMKLWNGHIATCEAYSDALILFVCQRFVQRFGSTLVSKNLRHNFLLHLLTIWDFGLITAEALQQLINDVDKIKQEQGQICVVGGFV